jgi:long-chain acyl-CoA synthetase
LSIDGLPGLLAASPDQRLRFVALDGTMLTKTFAQALADVEALMAELDASGIGPGDLVGLLGPNTYEYAIADLALIGLRCVSVALAVEGRPRPDELRELTERYQLAALLVTRAVPAGTELPPVSALLEERPLRLTPARWPAAGRPELPEGVFTIVFSSGTTGGKKGLMLTRDGIDNTIEVSSRAWAVRPDDDILIVMPFSNFQQRYLLYLAITAGCGATVVPPERLFFLLKSINPTIILGPPSFYELAYNRVTAAGRLARLPFVLLDACALGPLSRPLRARLGRKWTGMYGSRVRLMLTGSAPVAPQVVRWFQRLGAPLFEVYGSTETGWIAFNLPGRSRVGAAGRPVDGTDVELGADSEVIVRTKRPQAAGYVFHGLESAPAVFLPDGAIATGDLGRFSPDGFLTLTGRKKNIIITRSGVKINPEELESEIEQACRVTRAVVLPYDPSGLLACIAWLEDDTAGGRAAELDAYISRANQARDAPRRISRVIIRPSAELTVESGLLTRNFKIDRQAVTRAVFGGKAGAP